MKTFRESLNLVEALKCLICLNTSKYSKVPFYFFNDTPFLKEKGICSNDSECRKQILDTFNIFWEEGIHRLSEGKNIEIINDPQGICIGGCCPEITFYLKGKKLLALPGKKANCRGCQRYWDPDKPDKGYCSGNLSSL